MSAASNRHVAVLTVHHVYANGHVYSGGAEKFILHTIDVLLRAGIRVSVGYSGSNIYEDLKRKWPEDLRIECVNWINEKIAGDGDPTRETISNRQNWFTVRGADTAFFVQQASGAAFHASVVAAKSLGLRVVSTIRQSPADPPPTGSHLLDVLPLSWRNRIINRVRLPAICSDAVIFNSERIAADYQVKYRIPKVLCRVIYNGEPAQPDWLLSRRTRPVTFGSVGRVSIPKGAITLIEGFSEVARHNPDARLVYFGDGPDVALLKERSLASGFENRIRIAGYCDDRDAMYREIDIYAQASHRESMSNSVLEAMARGLPCIVTNVGGLPELVLDGVTGTVTAVDSRDLAKAMRELLGDPYKCRRYGEAGMRRVSESFGMERFQNETLSAVLG